MQRGKNPASAIPHSSVFFDVAVLGAGASAPTIPLDGTLTAASSVFPIAANGVDPATLPTRTSAGLYVITYVHKLPHVIPQSAQVVSAGGAPTAALDAAILKVVPSTRQVTVLVSVPSTGVATDMGTSDMLVMTLKGYDTSKP
jgi:hypothetical protein